MNAPVKDVSRRGVLGGGLVLAFSMLGPGRPLAQDPRQTQEGQNVGAEPRRAIPLPGSLKDQPVLDAWIRVDPDGKVTVFTGKVEIGQGIKTALLQVAAEQLGMRPEALQLVTGDTGRTPNEGYTAGSHSMQDSGTALMHAAAQVREILVGVAAERLGLQRERLRAENGAVLAEDGRRLGFGALVADNLLRVEASPESRLKDPATFAVVGQPLPRVDIPGKLAGGLAYVQDLRLPGMLHGRVARPPGPGARLLAVDAGPVERMAGVAGVVRDGSFLAVLAQREYPAIMALRTLERSARWEERATLPDQNGLPDYLRSLPADDTVILDSRAAAGTPARTVEAGYSRAYQLHGSIGPSCAVALFENGQMTVWTHTQGVFPLRQALAQMLRLPPAQVRCIHMEGSGCYGHNAADDAAADAALLARTVPGRPVRVQWMREDEHGWEPYGPAMATAVRASLDGGGRIVDWRYEVWSNTHNARPGPAGNLLAAQTLAEPFQPSRPVPIPQPEGGGDRNGIPLYHLPNCRVVHHFIPGAPLRVSAMRGLGAYMNVFTIESFMDELAAAANADPVEFRLRHMEDQRARDVITTAAERFGWTGWRRPERGTGRGFAFARYKNLGAYCALAVEVRVDRDTGRARLVRAVAAADSGQAVNPDGIRNQVEGGIVQSSSWTLYESVAFDRRRVTSRDWGGYPILRFPAVPDTIEVHIVDRPGQPFLGTGEAAQGPAAGAIGNAVADAVGVRLRELPITRERIRAALGA